MGIKQKLKLVLPACALVIAGVTTRPVYNLGVAFGLWQPFRPQGIPASAHYVSRIENGTWLDCFLDMKRNVDVCLAWNDDGRELGSGDFRLECESRAATAAELRPSATISSGGHLDIVYLFGDHGPQTKTLVPIAANGIGDCPEVK